VEAREYRLDDTIAALATGSAGAYRAIVRVSGRDAFRMLRALDPTSARRLRVPFPRVLDVALEVGLAAPVPAEAWVWRRPRSYTMENMVELHIPGAVPIARAVLDAVLRAGARLAAPGEFTFRAVIHGKMDLTEAEAIMSLTRARTPESMRIALEQLDGGLKRRMEMVREQIWNLLVEVEAALDFVEEDVPVVDRDRIFATIDSVLDDLRALSEQMRRRGMLRHGLRVVLTGRPNAGKSSLFNRLVRQQRAIVSPVPGTTRDYLQARVRFGNIEVELVDTPGLEDNPNREVDARAQELAKQVLRRATVVVHCVPADRPEELEFVPRLSEQDAEITERVVVITRSDLVERSTVELLAAQASERGWPVVVTSARTGTGLEQLEALVQERLVEGAAEGDVCTVETAARCRQIVERMMEALQAAYESTVMCQPEDIIAADLRAALDALYEITGALCSEDILAAIFSRFCIGK